MTATRIDIVREVAVPDSSRVNQLGAMFDVPVTDRARVEWHGSVEFDAQDWQVGLIVGPSGAGKSTILNEVYGSPLSFDWSAPSVIDNFAARFTMDDIANICMAVGFNTVPAWMRPYDVLSTGEKFRVELARRMIETPDDETIVADEFTSVVDRQVAKIGAHAVAKWTRRHPGRRFVAASCHYDIIDWLQPDWLLEPETMTFTWRSVQPRPRVDCIISPVPYSAWGLFARFHYLTSDLHRASRCFCLFARAEGSARYEPAAFIATLRRPHPKAKNIIGVTRGVTLPDWQGLGLGHYLNQTVASAFTAIGERLRLYPAHPILVRAYDKDPMWALISKPGEQRPNWTMAVDFEHLKQGRRPNAVFEYAGPVMELGEARRFLGSSPTRWNRPASAVATG